MVERKIKKSTQLVLDERIRLNKNPRSVALEIARKRIDIQKLSKTKL